MSAVRDYLSQIQDKYRTDVAGEHAYRPALQELLQSADAGLNAVNDPARTEIGMPDFVVLRQQGNVPIGIVEAKDIGNQLSRTEKSEQIKRYLAHGNLILTNYLEFRWYVNGEKVETVRIARLKQGKIQRISAAYGDLIELLQRFARQTTQSVNSARELADRLARSAHFIAHFIEKDLKSGAPSANLQNQMAAFQKTLLPDLDIPSFADMYAQTLAYGLFASRVNYPGDPAEFSLRGAADDIPRTNPFLRDLFYHSRFDMGRRLTWMAESLVEILRHTDMDSILAHFGTRTGQTDPVVHFYESFLSAYNPSLRETRGVYYTPEPVVKYIVRSVDHILKTRFDRPRGLADENALILDPAAGTGTFLYFVIEQIKEAFAGQRGLWKSYVEERLLPRIFGFELLMAPYTVAHMNLSLQLKEAGYEFKEGERLGIYLTNSLEEAKEAPELPFANFIADEANQAAAIKREKPIMVVLGNPPYSGHSANKGEWIGKLVRDYYFVDGEPIGERNSKGLQDDYVKFIRFGQWRIERTGSGILAFITSHSFLDGITYRGMRQHLMQSFSEIYVYNLHGNTRTRESAPDGRKDDNVFDILQGVSICFLVKQEGKSENPQLYYADAWGSRLDKHQALNANDLSTTDWIALTPDSPFYMFVPQLQSHQDMFESLPSITQVFELSSNGFKTHRDHFAIAFNEDELQNRITDLLDSSKSEDSIRSTYNLRDNSNWTLRATRDVLKLSESWKEDIVRCSYRPFDIRLCLYGDYVMDRPRLGTLCHVLQDNIALAVGRQGQAVGQQTWNLAFASTFVADTNLFYRGGIQYFPIYIYPSRSELFDEKDDGSEFPLSHKGRRPNLSKAFVAELEAKLGLPFQTEGSAFANGDSPDWFGPEDVFYYAYAIFHSPTYRERYAEFLKIDFPRLPLTSDVRLFATLVELGAELVSLHLMKSSKLEKFMTKFDEEGDREVARGYPKYTQKGGRVHINKTQYFGGVPADIWDFHIGGYQVLHKWLKDRRGRKLAYDDLMHYQKIVVALAETKRIMSEIDSAIPGFPLK